MITPKTLYETDRYNYRNLSKHPLCPNNTFTQLRSRNNNFQCCMHPLICDNTVIPKNMVLDYHNNKQFNKKAYNNPRVTRPSIMIDIPARVLLYELSNNLADYTMSSDDTETKCNNYFLIPNFITLDGQIYTKQKLLGCGAYGQIYEYMNTSGKKYSIKIVKDEQDSDIIIAKYLNDNLQCKNYIIDFNLINNNIPIIKEKYLLMEYYDGNLSELDIINTFTYKQKLNLFIHLIEACLCFKNANMYYLDLKPGNILYKHISFNVISCVFGDIGSLCIKNITPEGIATYPYPQHHHKGIVYPANFEKTVVWGLLVLFMSFFCDVSQYLVYNVVDTMDITPIFASIRHPELYTYMTTKMKMTDKKTKVYGAIPSSIDELLDDMQRLNLSI